MPRIAQLHLPAAQARPLAPAREALLGRYAGGHRPGNPIARHEIARACIADNDNVNPMPGDLRMLLGFMVAGPLMATLGVLAITLGLPG